MEFNPIAQIGAESKSDQPNNKLNKSLCLICDTDGEFVKKPQITSFEKLLASAEFYQQFSDSPFGSLFQKLKNISPDSLASQGHSYHLECYKKLTNSGHQKRLLNNKRKHDEVDSTPETAQLAPRRRSSVNLYDKSLCIFCQTNKPEQLHEVTSKNRDNQLKKAFSIAPKSTEYFRIRYNHAHDARAGDVKYHTSCWETNVTRAVPDFSDNAVDDVHKTLRTVVSADIADAVKRAIASGSILTMKDIVNAYEVRNLFCFRW